MDARDNIANDLFYKIRSRFKGLKLGNEDGAITINPEEARFFDFDYMEGEKPIGHVSISLAEPNSMKVYFSHGITEGMNGGQKDNWYGFLRELRQFAKRRLLNFDTRDIAKDNLDKRDYEFLSQNSNPKPTDPNIIQTPVGESLMNESSLYGTKTMSYQKLMDTRLIIKHSQALQDDMVPGARTRHISALFVENQDGERFKYPFIHLAGARAMQRHVANGGVPYDDIGKSLIQMSEEIAQLKSFSNYVVRNDLMNSDTNGIVEQSQTQLNSLREQIKALSKQSHYEMYRENFQAHQPLEVPEDVIEDYTEKFTVKNFKEDIKSVFPVIYRLMKEHNNIGYDDIVAMTTQTESEVNDQAVIEEEFEDEFSKFESWVMNLGEDSAITSEDPEEQAAAVQTLQELVGQHFPAGVDGQNAIESLKGLIEDPELYKRIKAQATEDPDSCVRGLVKDWLEFNAPEVVDQLDFGDYVEEPAPEDPTAYADAAADADAEYYGQQESIGEADEPTPKQKRKWGSWWKDYDKSPEEFGVKPNVNAGKPYPKYKRVPRPGATKSWDVDYVYDDPDEKAAYDQGDKDYYAQPEYKAYSDARSAHHKEMEKVKKAHYAKHGRFDATITIMNPFFDPKSTDPEDEDTPEEIDVGVDYDMDVSGEDLPATMWEPPEYAEREVTIHRVIDLDTGEDITDEVDHQAIEDALDNQGQIMSASDYIQDKKDQAAIDRWEASRESTEMEASDPKHPEYNKADDYDLSPAQRGKGTDKYRLPDTKKHDDRHKRDFQKRAGTYKGESQGMDVKQLAEFITSFYDRESGTFPKGPEGVCTMVGKKFGEQAEQVARKFVERMAPQQTSNNNPELAELARIKQLSGI